MVVWVVILTIGTQLVLSQPCPDSAHPRTTVSLIQSNGSVDFSCYDEMTGEFPAIVLKINGTDADNLLDTGIEVRDIRDGSRKIGFNFSIATTAQNNNTEIQCFFSACVSNVAYLYIVNEVPMFSDPLSINFLNTTAINVSWKPIWHLPVSVRYTLMITFNGTAIDGQQLESINTSYSTSQSQLYYVLLRKEYEALSLLSTNSTSMADCLLVSLSVIADTDVGSTDEGPVSVVGFPRDFNLIDFSSVNVSVSEIVQGNRTPSLELVVKYIPPVCGYEELTYSVDIHTARATGNRSVYSTGYNSSFNASIQVDLDALFNDSYCLEKVHATLTVSNEFGQSRHWIVYRNDLLCLPEFEIMKTSSKIMKTSSIRIMKTSSIRIMKTSVYYSAPLTISHTAIMTTDSTRPSRRPPLGTKDTNLNTTLIGIACGAGVLSCLLGLLVLSLVLLYCKKSRKNQDRDSGYSASHGALSEDFILPKMVNNDKYDCFIDRSLPAEDDPSKHFYETVIYETVGPRTTPETMTPPRTLQYNVTGTFNGTDILSTCHPPSPTEDYVEMSELVVLADGDPIAGPTDVFAPRYTVEPTAGNSIL